MTKRKTKPEPANDDVDEYYVPPERLMSINAITPEGARKDADTRRELLLDPRLSTHDAEQIANGLAQNVSAYGDVDRRIDEIDAGNPYKDKNLHIAMCLEHNALQQVLHDKAMTAACNDKLSSAAIAVASMTGSKNVGRPVDLLELQDQIQTQMKDLATSGADREDRIAMLAILSQKAGEAILADLPKAKSAEARAIMLKQATNAFETSGRLTEKLHKLNQPVTANVYDSEKPIKTNHLLEGDSADRSNTSKLVTRKTKKSGPGDSRVAPVGARARAKD